MAMVRLNDMFLIHGAESFLNGASPYDSYIILRDVTLSGGSANLDLSEILQDASLCEYTLLKKENTDSDGLLAVNNTAIADDATVTVLVFTHSSNIKELGE